MTNSIETCLQLDAYAHRHRLCAHEALDTLALCL